MAVTINIASTDRSSTIRYRSIRLRKGLNNRADVLTFEIVRSDSDTYSPSVNDDCEMLDGSTKIFNGVIVEKEESVRGGNPNLLTDRITAKSDKHKLDRQLVTKSYSNTDVATVVGDIVSNFTTGFTSNNTTSTLTIDKIAFERDTVSEALQDIADLTNHQWYVDENQDVHFFTKGEEVAPFDLSDGNNYFFDSLEITDTIDQLRNAVFIEGGVKDGSTRTETLAGDDARTTSNSIYDLVTKFTSTPTVKVNGSDQTVGTEFLDDDAGNDVMWSYREKYLRFTSGNEPSDGDTIEITGTEEVPILLQVEDSDSIAEFGRFEHAIRNQKIESNTEAEERGRAELEAYADQLVEGSYVTDKAGLRPGQLQNISSTKRSIDKDVIIQRVDVTVRDPNGDRLDRNVQFATFKSIGIIEWMKEQMRERQLTKNEEQNITRLIDVDDAADFTDSVTITAQTQDYVWAPSGSDTFSWSFGVWEPE